MAGSVHHTRLVERRGAPAVLRAGLLGIVATPLVLVLYPARGALVANEIISGVSWAMVNTAWFTVLLGGGADPAERTRWMNAMLWLTSATQFAAIACGWLVLKAAQALPSLPFLGDSLYRLLFLVAFVVRLPLLLIAWRWLPRIDFLTAPERRDLWRLFPGAEPMVLRGRTLMRMLRD